MALYVGSSKIGSLYLGSTKIGAAYLGNVKVYESAQPPAPSGAVIGGRTYPTVDMPDGNTWLAVNLDFAYTGLPVPTSGAQNVTTPQAVYYGYDESTYGWNGYKCGLLYNWYAVDYMEQNKSTLFPGWHVPTEAEWDALATAVGYSTAGTKLKASNVSWASSWGGTDDYGFAALPAGYFYNGFYSVGSYASFWTSRQSSSNFAYNRYFDTSASMLSSDIRKKTHYSVRLVKDT